jgi:hypothetical protein
MKRIAPVNNLAVKLSWLVTAILLLLPFHAFLSVWLSSWLGHYTLLRLWKEFLLVPIVLGSIFILLKDRLLLKKFGSLWLVRLIAAYSLLLVICALWAWHNHSVTPKAMWYGLLVDLRFLVFFLAVWAIAAKSNWLDKRWPQILFGPAILVAAIAILQYLVLPYDFLKHFGYGDSTIYPYETINHNLHHLRVMSTLRGANPLGAYLLIPICVWALALTEKRGRRGKVVVGAGLLLALLFSFSRGAWIGAAAGLAIIAGLAIKSSVARRRAGQAVVALVILASLAGLLLRNNLTFQNAILHTDRASKAAQSSNQGHTAAFKLSAKDIIRQPLGRGVGTAGPQSVYNDQPARIAENYYLQIGQEAGVLGMVLFIAICVAAGRMLLAGRTDPLALALFAALIGLSLVNLLSHAWSDDTLAYIFWGVAAIALAPRLQTPKNT